MTYSIATFGYLQGVGTFQTLPWPRLSVTVSPMIKECTISSVDRKSCLHVFSCARVGRSKTLIGARPIPRSVESFEWKGQVGWETEDLSEERSRR